MKTDEQWAKEYSEDQSINRPRKLVWRNGSLCRAIQIDALEFALAKALELNDRHEWPMSRFLEAEIQKLKDGK